MSKRRLEGGLDEAINMDVMMDNMTDVVGTLLMVLIIVQLKVNVSIDNIQSNLPKVTQEQAAEAKQQAAAIEESVHVAQEELKRKFETTPQQNDVNLLALDELKAKLDERQKQIEAAKLELTTLLDEREKLKGLLENTPIPMPPPAKIVRMPAAREIPEGAELLRVLCCNGRIYNANTAYWKQEALEAFYKSRNSLILTRGPFSPDKDTNIYDHEKTANLLTKRGIGNREFRLEFPVVKTQNRIHMQIKPEPEGGESPEEFNSSKSKFIRSLRLAKRDPRAVIWFLVFNDSFETYLQARDLCDQVGVPAGWELNGSPWLAENLNEFETNVITPPPPPAPPVPGAISIPAPKKTID